MILYHTVESLNFVETNFRGQYFFLQDINYKCVTVYSLMKETHEIKGQLEYDFTVTDQRLNGTCVYIWITHVYLFNPSNFENQDQEF